MNLFHSINVKLLNSVWLMLTFCGTVSGESVSKSLASQFSTEVIVELLGDIRAEATGAQKIFASSLSNANHGGQSVSIISASFASFDEVERKAFMRKFIEWCEGLGYHVARTDSLNDAKTKGGYMSYLLTGNGSDAMATIVYVNTTEAPKFIAGERGLIDDYLFIIYSSKEKQ